MSKTTKIVLSVLAGLAVLACAGGAFGFNYLKNAMQDAVPTETYQQITKGDAQEKVRDLTGGSQDLAKDGIKGTEPPVPAGAACDYSMGQGLQVVYRFCFTDGKLVQKDEIKIETK